MNGPLVRLAVVIPAGPADDVVDTLRSVLRYTSSPRAVVVVDDTGRDMRDVLEAMSPEVHVLAAPPHAPGGFGGLWVKIAFGYKYVAERCSFDVLLRLDADALMIGDGLPDLAGAYFATNPGVGMLGSYRTGADGATRDWAPAARMLRRERGLRGLDQPKTRRLLRRLYASARAQGYLPGEHALGGAYLHSRAAVLAIHERGWLCLDDLAPSRLGEDHIFGLLTRAAGFAIADFGGPDGPLALRWKGLPSAPEELLLQGKLVTHSVRSWPGLSEQEIRKKFADARGTSSIA